MTMIEKVARASFACWRKRMDELGHHLDRGQTFEDMGESEKEFALLNARAMIEAMREPSEGMEIAAGRDHCGDDHYGPHETWRRMIDAALNEK
jgi:hypothetical protein